MSSSKIFLFFLLAVTSISSCKKTDQRPTEKPDQKPPVEEVETSAVGLQSEIIRLQHDLPVDSGEIEGMLGTLPVTLNYVPDSGLTLQIPYQAEVGANKLTIPSVPDFETYIDVKAVQLPSSTEEMIASLSGMVDSYVQSLEATVTNDSASMLKLVADEVNQYLASAPAAERTRFAAFIHANRKLFDAAFAVSAVEMGEATLPWESQSLHFPEKQLLAAGGPRKVTAAMSSIPELQRQHLTYRMRDVAAEFSRIAAISEINRNDDLPEKAAATLLTMGVWERANLFVNAVLDSYPIASGVQFSTHSPNAYNSTPIYMDGGSEENGDGGLAANLDGTLLGSRDTVFVGLTVRGFKESDREKARRVHGEEESRYPGVKAFFDGFDAYMSGVKLLNASVAKLKVRKVLTRIEAVPSHINLNARTGFVRMPMPASMLQQFITFNIADKYRSTYHGEEPGQLMLTLNYAEGQEPTGVSVDGYSVKFAYQDDFTDIALSKGISITFPRADHITLAVKDDQPLRLTIPYGRMSLELVADVFPATAPQNVSWRVVSGADLATVDSGGKVTATGEGIGFVVVRAAAKRSDSVYADIKVKVTSYKLNYIAGDDQVFPGGVQQHPFLFSVLDKIDNECLYDPVSITTGEKLQVKMSSSDIAYNDAYTPNMNRYYDEEGDWLPCWLSGYVYIPESGRTSDYKTKIKIELLQDGHVIDSQTLDATIKRVD